MIKKVSVKISFRTASGFSSGIDLRSSEAFAPHDVIRAAIRELQALLPVEAPSS